MSHTNRTSSIRSGFDYQDFWGLSLCGQWLVKPSEYKWVQFETCPDETDSNNFFLDDIVCLDSGDLYHLYQIKHRQDPQNGWNWDELLNADSPKSSLIKKWSGSLIPRLEKTKSAFFVTNAKAADEVAKYLNGEIFDIQKIRTEDVGLYNRIVVEVGDEKMVDGFFRTFHFRFDQQNLSGDELETSIRKYFYDNLNATESGVTNLYHSIKKECRERNPRQLDIETLRTWCEFDTPRALVEQFDIPSDFEFFDNHTHNNILSDLQKPEGGIKIIFGKPGVGKSVYLSKLDKELTDKKIISIKHHYHISPEDSSPQERLNAVRVIEAMKSQLKSHKDELGSLANKNSKDIPVSEFVGTIAQKLNKEKKAFVVIIDGLDHVLRYSSKEELEGFLKAVCLPQAGLWIVIGMQAVAKSHLPQIIIDKCPETQWTEIKGLTKDGVSKLVSTNKIELNLPSADQLKSLSEKLYSITAGNPLHLRYSLQQLKNLSGNSLVTEYSCNSLIPYGEGIEKYYESLWNQISDNAKTLLLTIASVNFLFTEKQLIESVSLSTSTPADITNAFSQISHLVSENLRSQMSVYHNSFEVFLKNKPEMGQQRIVIKTNVKKWLGQSSYEYLKWAEMRTIEHELGNSTPILEIDRQWLIDAICYPSNPSQISNQMKLAVRVACENGNFSKGLQISYLHTYYENSVDAADEATRLIWEESLYQNQDIFDYINLESLGVALLSKVAQLAESKGKSSIVEEVTDILIESLDRQEYRQNTIPRATAALLETIPYDRGHKPINIHKYIIQFREQNITDSLFGIYAQKLLCLAQKDKITELLSFDLTEPERQSILIECTEYGFKNNADDISSFFEGVKDPPLRSSIYQFLKGKPLTLPVLPARDIFVDKIREHDSEDRAKWRQIYYTNFLNALITALLGKEKDIEKWIHDVPDIWSAKAMATVFSCALRIASGIKISKIDYVDVFAPFSDLNILKWPEDRGSLGFQDALRDTIDQIIKDLISIKRYQGVDYQISVVDYNVITGKPPFYSKTDVVTLVLDSNELLLKEDLYKKIKDEDINKLATTINYFPERATDYAHIAKLARLYGDVELSKSLLKKAADNLLGYGYHKDTYFFDVLEAIGFCAQGGVESDKVNRWVEKLIPLIDSVGDFTDGDETHYLPSYLADFLAKQNSTLLYKYYHWAADKEKFYYSEDLFKSVIKSLDFRDDVQIALASTALDEKSFSELKQISDTNSDAAKALNVIQSYLGEVNYQKEKNTPYIGPEKPKHDYSKVKVDELLTHLNTNFENRWDWNNYLIGWEAFWNTKISKADIYNVFKQIIEKFGVQALSGEVLDVLYPIAYEVDSSAAFDVLCQAQDSDHGWNRYWTDKKKAELRWRYVKEKYPQRYIEFFKNSTNFHVPLSRGVEYLLQFGDIKKAEEITQASIDFAESLVAGSVLPIPEWLIAKNEITIIDILLQRLLWSSPLVRERASTAVAQLIYKGTDKVKVLEKLLVWIKSQRMETTVAIGLVTLIKVFYLNKDRTDLSHVDFEKIIESVPINSEVIKKLVEEICLLMEKSVPTLLGYSKINSFPEDYLIDAFFTKFIKTFLAPIYFQRAGEIEKRSGKPFLKQWSYTASEVIREASIELDANHVYYYASNEDSKFLCGFSPKTSEAYRSAFVRVLQDYYDKGDIAEDFYLDYIYATLPIELSKWKIVPNRSPDWWPKLDGPYDEKKESVEPIVFKALPEDLIKEKDGKLIIGAEGAVQPSNGWVGSDPEASFSLLAFGYKVIGPNIPTPKEVSDEILYSPSLAILPSATDRPFHFLEEQNNCLLIGDEATRIKDLLIYPIVVREHDLPIALWQYFRDYNAPLNLTPYFSDGLELVVNDTDWSLQDSTKKSVVIYTDWLEGLKERYYPRMPLPHGQCIIADKAFVDTTLDQYGLRLGYVLKTTHQFKKYSYEKVQKYEDFKLLNVSSIIV